MPLWRFRPGVSGRIDIADYRRMKQSGLKWHAQKIHGLWYVVGGWQVEGWRYRVYLTRWLTDAPPGSRVVHRNGKLLDFRRSNLVVVPQKRT